MKKTLCLVILFCVVFYSPAFSQEICDGIDNDGNGLIDEGNPGGGAPCGSSIGACSPGTLTCVNGVLTCVGAVLPETEICDGIDNDCDGLIDEGTNFGNSCGSSTGTCQTGQLICVAGSYICIGGVSPSPEVCDGIDNDCDGVTDEDAPTLGPCGSSVIGACAIGTWTCVGGSYICVGGVFPSPEVCDGIDNDCDGLIDEDITITVILPGGTGTTTSNIGCDNGSWTYYKYPGTGDYFFFAIEWDPDGIGGAYNAAAKAAAIVSLQINYPANVASDPTAGTFFMGRQWDVDLGGNTLDGPVNIKFYYHISEKTTAEDASALHASTYGLTDNGFKWFKMNGSINFNTVTNPAFIPDFYLLEAATGPEDFFTYSQLNGITSFSSVSGGAGTGNGGALPVELFSFTGNEEGPVNVLNWVTATEVNSNYFEVERLMNGNEFTSIGKESAAGNSNNTLNYRYVDTNPIDISYYRLKQVDLDGAYSYSNLISVLRTSTSITISSIRPSPTRDFTSIQFNNGNKGSLNLKVIHASGKIVMSRVFDSIFGANSIELNLSSLPEGIYYLVMDNGVEKANAKIVKIN